jgi:hypothetical protein
MEQILGARWASGLSGQPCPSERQKKEGHSKDESEGTEEPITMQQEDHPADCEYHTHSKPQREYHHDDSALDLIMPFVAHHHL